MRADNFAGGWKGGLPETPCGYGSTLAATERQRRWIPAIFELYEIRSVADIGAGDLNWIAETDLSGINYRAYDLNPRAPGVERFNLLEEIPPAADCIMCLWVLNHLAEEEVETALANIAASGASYLMVTHRPACPIILESIEILPLNEKGDCIKFIRL
jgi:hypothetical protein